MAKENIILTKESNQNEIKSYFSTILELSKTDNEFPINLDEVWMLVYARKSDAVDGLQNNFIEDVDYKVLRKNPQNPNGGRPTNCYYLSVSCLEFFIARKVRPVFEVYRQVFHQTAKNIQRELSRKELAQMIIQAEEEKEKLQLIAHEQEEQLKIQAPKVEYHDKVLSSQGYLTTNMIASCLGMTSIKLNKLLCSWGIQYKESSTYYLYSKFRDKGYAVHKPYPYTDSDGNIKTRQQMYWTETGKQFILSTYNQRTA